MVERIDAKYVVGGASQVIKLKEKNSEKIFLVAAKKSVSASQPLPHAKPAGSIKVSDEDSKESQGKSERRKLSDRIETRPLVKSNEVPVRT